MAADSGAPAGTRFPGGRLAQSSLALTALVGAAYALNYVFYLVLSRGLPIEQFGRAGGFLAIIGVVSLLSSALLAAVPKLVAQSPGAPLRLIRAAYLRRLRLPCIALLAGSGITALFQFEFAVLMATAAVVPLRDVHCGLLLGRSRNGAFGTVVAAEALLRVGGAAATAWVPQTWVPLAAWLGSFVFGWVASWALVARELGPATEGALAIGRTTMEAIGLRAPQVSFLNTDVILVALLFAGRPEVGSYVAAALLSRIPFYLVTPFVMGEIPKLVDPKLGPAVAGRAFAIGASGAAVLSAPLIIAPAFCIGLLFGDSYAAGAAVLPMLALAGFLLVQCNSASYALFARGHGPLAAGALAVGATAEVAMIAWWASTMGTVGVSWAAVAATALSFGCYAIALLRYWRAQAPNSASSHRE